MKWCLAIMAILCSCVVNKAQMGEFEIKSMRCDKLNDAAAPKFCIGTRCWFCNELCEYECDEYGILRTKMCNCCCGIKVEHPMCEELYCTRNEFLLPSS